MMSGKNSVSQLIKALVTVVTLVALTGGFRVIKATLDDVCGLTRRASDTVWPAQLAYRLRTLHIIDQILDVDLHRWTPVRGWKLGCHQYTTSSNSTTLESTKSDCRLAGGLIGLLAAVNEEIENSYRINLYLVLLTVFILSYLT